MAKKILLKDLNGVELLPITRAKLILDSSGKQAFRSTSLVATEDQPGLMSPDDKKLIKNAIIAQNTINSITTITDINNTTIYPKTIAKAVVIYDTNLEDYLETKLTLNVDKKGGENYFIQSIKQTNGLIEATVGGIVDASKSGLVPKINNDDNLSISSQINEWVLTSTSEGNPTWKKLPLNAFNNTSYLAMTIDEATTGTAKTSRVITANVLHNKILKMLPLVMKGATTSEAGASGLVPAPSLGYQNRILSGAGTWIEYSPNELKWIGDVRNTNTTPSDYKSKFKFVGIKTPTAIGLSSSCGKWLSLIGWKGYSDNSGPKSWELASDQNNRLHVRSGAGIQLDGTGDEDWGPWNTIAYVSDFNWNNIPDKPTSFTPISHNHPTTQIVLVNYSKATTAEDLVTPESLNTALGKLEYKADTAYKFIAATMSETDDNNTTIDRLKEVFDVLSGITDTETIKALVGKYLLLDGGIMTGEIKSMDIIPKSNLGYNLGSATNSYNVLYTQHIDTLETYDLKFKTGGTEHIRIRASDGALIPISTGTKDIGSSTYKFKNIYGTLKGNADTATKLLNARTLTIGSTGKTFDGSSNVSWTLADIGLGNVQNTAFYIRPTKVNGTSWHMAGTVNNDAFTIFAPTSAGTSGQVLTSTAETPEWTNQSDLSVGEASVSSRLKTLDLRDINHLPNSSNYPDKHITGWFNSTGTPTSAWYSGLTIKGWTNTYQTWQIASGSATSINEKLYYRCGITNSSGTATWNNWKQIAFTSDFSGLFTALSISNGTLSATIGGTTKSVALSVSNFGTTTIGATGRPIYLNAGTPTPITINSSTSTLYITGVTSSTSNIYTGTKSTSGVRISGGNTLYAYGGFYESSDNKLKNFKENIEINFEKLKQLPKKYFTWKSDETDKLNIGTSAQELQKLYPELVSEDENGLLHVAYDKLSIIALSAIDKLYEEICELKSIINNLQNK